MPWCRRHNRIGCLLLICCLLLAGCGRPTLRESSVFAMDTVCTLQLPDADCEAAVTALLNELERDWSRTRTGSLVSALNRGEARCVAACFDGTYYPEGAEYVPNAVAIRRVNEQMVQEADAVVCYVRHPGNSRDLLEYARRKHKTCINLAV